MPTKKLKDKNIRSLTKLGRGSLAVTIPKEIVTKLKWKEKQKVVVALRGKGLIVKDWQRPS